MTSHLQHKLSIAPLVEQRAGRRSLHRQTAKDERPGSEADDLVFGFPVLANHLNRLDLPLSSFRDNKVGKLRIPTKLIAVPS
jgi:hypothetical protein